MKKILVLLLLLLGVSFSSVVITESFNNVGEMKRRISSLNEEEYKTLRIFVIPSSRNVAGMFGAPYNIVYKTNL